MRPRLAWQALGQELCILKTNTDLDTADLGSGEWMSWDQLADEETLERTAKALKSGGTAVYIVGSGAEAKEKLFGIMREGATVMEASSATMEQIGVTSELASSKKYSSVRNTVRSIDDPKKREEERKKGILSEYCIGSVQAITEEGQMVVASATGSQIAPYAYGAGKIILVAGTQKIVRNLDDAFKRIKEHVYPLENERLQKTLGIGSSINKILIIEKEREGRITMILVKEKLGF